MAGERVFDLRRGVDTSARVGVGDLDAVGPYASHASRYEPVDARGLRKLLADLALPHDAVFCDYGCGKGRALLLAHEYGFQKVVGLEFSSKLTDVARANVRRYCRDAPERQVQVIDVDAADYELSDDETVLFFFNPFDGVVMAAALEKIKASLRRADRALWVLYFNPEHRALFDESSAFQRVGEYTMPCLDAVVYRSRGQVLDAELGDRSPMPGILGHP
ncbi:class I SAM-dependent methyltransferase [Actinomycetospora sp. C-140]